MQLNGECKSSRKKNPVILGLYSLTQKFIQQVFMERLLYAKHNVGTGMQ